MFNYMFTSILSSDALVSWSNMVNIVTVNVLNTKESTRVLKRSFQRAQIISILPTYLQPINNYQLQHGAYENMKIAWLLLA